jgi:hypothetical protein
MRRSLAAVVLLGTLLATTRAEAIPAFARRTRTSCRGCHAWSFPLLTPWGTRYQQNGYQLPEGAEDPVRAAAMIEPGTIAERTAIFATPPLSVRSRVLAEWTEGADEERRLGLSVPYVRLVGGGSLFEDVSLIFSGDALPTPALHLLTIGFHDVLPDGALSIVAGQLLFTGFQRPGHRSLTRLGNPIAAVAVGDDPFQLEGLHVGVRLQGRPGWGGLSYELAVANGATGQRGQTGVGAPGILGRVLYTKGGHTLGVFGYGARARLRLDHGGIDREWDDRLALVGADAELSVWRLLAYAAGVYGVHDDPHGDGDQVRYFGGRGEVLWAVTDELSAVVRFDAVESADDASLEHRLLTLNVGHMLLTNLRGSVEATVDLIDLAAADDHEHAEEGHEEVVHENETRVLAFLEAAL